MLFKYEDGKPTQLKMVDFQIVRIGHPLCDVLHYLYSSTVAEVRRHNLHSWLSFYFTSLTTALKKLDAEVPDYTFKEFMVEYKRRCIAHLFGVFGVLKMILDKDVVSGLNEHDEETKDQPPTGNLVWFSSRQPINVFVRVEADKSVNKSQPKEVNEGDGLSDEVLNSFRSATDHACDPEVIARIIKITEEVKHFFENYWIKTIFFDWNEILSSFGYMYMEVLNFLFN